MQQVPTRRQVLQHSALVGVAATVGCLSGGDSGQTIGGVDGEDGSTATSRESTEDSQPGSNANSGGSNATGPESLTEWLADANGYGGVPRRVAPGSTATLRVGEPVDGGMAFAPAALEVAPMTTVRWEWTGHGGQHNVVALDGAFDSGRTNGQRGTCYHYVFEEPGEHRFVSEPRRDEGMKGAIIVREPPTTGNERVDQWLVDAGNFDGTVADETGAETATVTVGAAGNGGHFAFDPPVLKISTGATVQWKWTGEGPHNVAFQAADVGPSEVRDGSGVHFEHTFDARGTFRYACEPHQALGGKGAIIVE